jgi:protein gp37
MAERTGIEWTDATWTPIRARHRETGKLGWHCVHASEGCRNCYAETMNGRLGTGLPFKPGHARDIEITLDEAMLTAPLRWRKPRMIFVCSMTDLFADFVSDEMIDRIFAVMALCPQHTFQVLTKRAGRMRNYLKPYDSRRADGLGSNVVKLGYAGPLELLPWPLPNVWLGVSAEDRPNLLERVGDLRNTPAAVRFISAEPLLGDLGTILLDDIDWIIVGGESGPKARPMHPAWARSIRDQCAAAGTAFFFKQWGEWGKALPRPSGTPGNFAIASAGPHSEFWPQNVIPVPSYPRQFSLFGGATVRERLGKKAAGRLLDGVEHNAMPETRS